MIDQKVIQKFIILFLNSAQHLILALGMWNSQELFRLFKLKTRSSNTFLFWLPKRKKNEQLVFEQDETTSSTTLLFSGVVPAELRNTAWQKVQNKM